MQKSNIRVRSLSLSQVPERIGDLYKMDPTCATASRFLNVSTTYGHPIYAPVRSCHEPEIRWLQDKYRAIFLITCLPLGRTQVQDSQSCRSHLLCVCVCVCVCDRRLVATMYVSSRTLKMT